MYTVITIGTATTMTGPDLLVLPLYCMAQKFKFASKSFRYKFDGFSFMKAQFYTQCCGDVYQISIKWTDFSFAVLPLTVKP